MSLFVRMVREEYRLHAALFGSRRFVAFPLFVAVLVGGGGWLLGETGVDPGAVVAGVHVLVAFFGLQVGTIGLVGRDAMRDVLGDVTLLVFSARTLPVTWRRLLGTFLAKDVVYYVALFVTPVVVGLAPLLLAAGVAPARIGLLWLSVAGTFTLGAGASLTLVGIAGRSRLLVGLVIAAFAGLVLAGVDLIAMTPYAAYLDPSPLAFASGFAPALVLAVVAPFAFQPGSAARRRVRRVDGDTYERIRARFGPGTASSGASRDGAIANPAGNAVANPAGSLTARPLLEVARSSGSVWKVGVSLGILFGVAAFLLDRVAAATAIRPSAGLAFGALLGLGSFTTYNWVTQLDDPREYLRYPVGVGAVLAGKRRAYLLLSIPWGLAYLGLAAIWYPIADLSLGLVVFPAVAVYVFGLTTYVTGFSPNELLFDTPLFALFGGGLAFVAVPLLVCALAAGAYPLVAPAIGVGLSLLAGLTGVALARRAGPRWDARLRESRE